MSGPHLVAALAIGCALVVAYLAGQVSQRRSQDAQDAKLREGILRLGRAIADGLRPE